MRKYILSLLSLWSVLFLFVTFIASPVDAIGGPGPGQKGKNVSVNLTCSCENPGQPGDKVNKINCNQPKNWPNGYKGGPAGDNNQTPQPWSNYSFYCNSGWACFNQSGATPSNWAAYQNGNTGIFSSVPGWLQFHPKGVACKQPIADCTCNDPGSGSPNNGGDNSFTCRMRGAPNVTGTGACSSAPIAGNGANSSETSCLDAKGQKVTDTTVDHTGVVANGAILYGIKCGVVVLPPPPSPPCVQWNNGECSTVSTALGHLSTNFTGFVRTIFATLLSISGGIALLLIIKAGYQLMTSQGKPEQVQNGRDQLVAAIVGLVFLLFSFVFLQLIGFDILHIPGFGQ